MNDSIYSSKAKLKESPIHGKGLFATAPIRTGEILFVKNGHILTTQEKFSRDVIDCYWPINDSYVLGAKDASEIDSVKLFINHSCDPNCGLVGMGTGVAMRDIVTGEEITFDYAMLDNEEYDFPCHCGASNCRGHFTGFDWKKPELQRRYYGYFVDYLQEKINVVNSQ